MKLKYYALILLLSCFYFGQNAHAADLLEAAQSALTSDPLYQQAIAQRLSTNESVPIAVSALLPQISTTANPSLTRTGYSGSDVGDGFSPRNVTVRAYTLSLNITQTVFDYSQFATVAGAVSTAKGADATLNANLQNLILRVAKAYFTVLEDEEKLGYSDASKLAFAQQLDQVKQQYDVGIKTITDVYTAQASYDSAMAKYISAQTALANDKENLRVITGIYYSHLSTLRDDFPLVTPKPANPEQWVQKALQQNWSIKAAQYALSASKQAIQQQLAGHLPTMNLQGTLDRQYANNITGYRNISDRNGPTTQTDRSVALNINVPLFQGGGVIAKTNQATYNYQVAQQQLEQILRSTANASRQSYMNVISGISQIKADKQAIKSNISSLKGMEESYRVGTETLVNVLNQQQKLYEAQTEYAKDRYAFINNILILKQAAGTLSFDDLRALNIWLSDKQKKTKIKKLVHRHRH
jgi:outer membrane protein